VRQGGRRRARLLADVCGRFVRQAQVDFNSLCVTDVRETLRLLHILSTNFNLETLALKPRSCQIAWPDNREPVRTSDLFLDGVENAIQQARQLKHLSLGCISELCDHADELVELLTTHQMSSLQTLHIASVKENPDSYGLVDLPGESFAIFANLSVLGIDYDYVTDNLLLGFASAGRVPLGKLVVHVHGIDSNQKPVSNNTWRQIVRTSPNLEVTLNLIHSLDGVANMLDLLRPAMPLAHLRMFFCQSINVAGINFIARHNYAKFQSIHIIDGVLDDRPNAYDVDTDEDPFVMLAWKCMNLKDFTVIGYEVSQDDLIAIARLRGQQLCTLAVPSCCVATIEEEDDNFWVSFGNYGSEFISEVSRCLGQTWEPISDQCLHPAVMDSQADAETAYLHILQQDQAC
jgi:F-box protein 33